MKPFLFNEVFDISPNLVIQDAPLKSVRAVIVDDFLKHRNTHS